MSTRSPSVDAPVPDDALTTARELLSQVAAHARRTGGRVIVAPHGDADGLGAGALVIRALERLGATPIVELPGKGEHVHTPAMRQRLSAHDADALVVLDMGSRAGPIVEGLPTVVIDHHDAREVPSGVVFVSSAGREPVAPTGLLAYRLLRPLVELDDVAWLAVIATLGDLGERHPFADELGAIAARYRKTHLKETVALINAARRSGSYRPELALGVLLAASGPEAIARGEVEGVDALVRYRAEVNAELARLSRVAPRTTRDVALIWFSSSAQLHPLIATRWCGRLAPRIVIAANDGYLPGRVNFAVRSASDTDLLAFLRGLPLGEVEGEFANGHPRATGGSIPPGDFERMLRVLGFSDAVIHARPSPANSPPAA
jgi:single-stranded-DNA-specific exonuclease